MSLEERNQSPVADPEVPEIIEDTLDVPKITVHGQNRLFSIALQFVVLFAFWLLLSGRYEAKYIIIGAISAALVTFLTNDLFYFVLQRGERLGIKTGQVLLIACIGQYIKINYGTIRIGIPYMMDKIRADKSATAGN